MDRAYLIQRRTLPESHTLENYNLGFQYELPASFVLETSYIGNKGTRLEANGLDALDQLQVSALAFGDNLIRPLSANPGLAPLPYPGFTGTLAQALRKYPQYNGVSRIYANFGTSHYDSLQLQMTRHFTNGLSVLAPYTRSKALFTGSESLIDAASSQDVYNRGLEKAPTRLAFPKSSSSPDLELPFGKANPVMCPACSAILSEAGRQPESKTTAPVIRSKSPPAETISRRFSMAPTVLMLWPVFRLNSTARRRYRWTTLETAI